MKSVVAEIIDLRKKGTPVYLTAAGIQAVTSVMQSGSTASQMTQQLYK